MLKVQAHFIFHHNFFLFGNLGFFGTLLANLGIFLARAWDFRKWRVVALVVANRNAICFTITKKSVVDAVLAVSRL